MNCKKEKANWNIVPGPGGNAIGWFVCSNCHKKSGVDAPICPNCNSKMKKIRW